MKRKAYLLILIIGIIACILPNTKLKFEESATVNRIEYKENNPPSNSSTQNYEIQQVKFLTVAVQVQGEFDENLKSSPITCKCHVTRMTRLIYMDGDEELGTKSVIYKEKVGELMVPSKYGYTFVEWIDANNKVVDKNSIINSTRDYPIYAHYNIIVSQLKVDPNNGTWDGGTQPKEFSMEYNQTKDIPKPTRTGYSFEGWEITGEGSTINNTEFKMGVADTTLKAKWKANTYKINVNPDNGTFKGSTGITKVDAVFDQDTTIDKPVRTGFTFIGWEIDHGTLKTDTVIHLDYPGDINIKAKWKINNYKYITHYQQQNVNGSGYYTKESETGIANYDTIVYPPLKTYTGFSTPSQGSIRIQVDSDPPVKNVLEYKYARKKASLNINPNGGSISGPTNIDLYYDQQYSIPTPSRPGYTFNGWTISGGSDSILSSDNKLTMKLQSTNLTARWNVNNYTVTYNVNGGNPISPTSRTITYATQYGSLPEPSRTGYQFLGWFTSKTGGSQVTGNTTYNTAGNTTLYARWQNDAPTISSVNVNYAHNSGGENGILTGGSETATITANIYDAQDGTPTVNMSCTSGTVCSHVHITKSVNSGRVTFTVTATAMGVGTLKITARDAAGVETTYNLILYIYGAGSSIDKDGTFTDNTYDSGYTEVLEGCYISEYKFELKLAGHYNSGNNDEIKIVGKTDYGNSVQLYNFRNNLDDVLHTIKDAGLEGRNNRKGNYITSIRFYVSVPTNHLSCVNKSNNITRYSIKYKFHPDLIS